MFTFNIKYYNDTNNALGDATKIFETPDKQTTIQENGRIPQIPFSIIVKKTMIL